jgi:NAD(P)H-dependent nitrite reductase small subunit
MKNLTASDPDLFLKVCSLDELPVYSGKRFYINDTDIAVFKHKEEVYAVSNVCPHQQAALMYDGFIEKEHVVCPVHGWMFSLDNGRTPSGCGKIDIYETRIEDNIVYVKVDKKELRW